LRFIAIPRSTLVRRIGVHIRYPRARKSHHDVGAQPGRRDLTIVTITLKTAGCWPAASPIQGNADARSINRSAREFMLLTQRHGREKMERIFERSSASRRTESRLAERLTCSEATRSSRLAVAV